MATVQLAQLLEAGVHFGHKANRWNPKMFPYIYSERDGIHILDLVQTSQLLNEASQFVNTAAQKDKIFLFVGTKRQATAIIEQEAKNCNSYYVNHRWLGGMLTNWKTVCTRIERLKKLEQQEQDGIFDLLPKKEVASTRKELEKLRMHLNGIKDMPRTPDVMIVVDQRRELTAIKEAISLNIPVISILDTNCDPDIVDIPIPGNDDSIGSIKLLLNTLGSNILSGQNQNID
jgi:small subunit ribosomal protein S2|uniref:Small ribosomal subunit protein uS2c n=1 Tax=Florenciella parvula TaxID=236787 RepID=A0A516ZA47_9STRA|nr:ribosomal protein S2 [Florenciella parvula]QDR24586.1 ribosomal protein S2 [Florenciella parvula]|tara:strand:+ start:22167 stop:22859 length:693 start_codon:yes stop_codon:yes gene_type:complete